MYSKVEKMINFGLVSKHNLKSEESLVRLYLTLEVPTELHPLIFYTEDKQLRHTRSR